MRQATTVGKKYGRIASARTTVCPMNRRFSTRAIETPSSTCRTMALIEITRPFHSAFQKSGLSSTCWYLPSPTHRGTAMNDSAV